MVKILLGFALIVLSTSEPTEKLWWETGSFYQIYPRSFKDSDGDGVGDLKGIAQELSYLKEIGIDGTWLSPIYLSPMADFGYDISNFTEIDPVFGTMADFDELMIKSKKVGVKIILDFVPNHTSDEHEWFIKSVQNDPEYADFYVWHPGKVSANGTRIPPTNWISQFRGSAWTWNENRQAYYLHQFHRKQPDLNYRNPKVLQTIQEVLRFWMRKGVAGFRVDTVSTLFEVAPDTNGNLPDEPRNPGVQDPEDYFSLLHIYTNNQPETYDAIFSFRQTLKEFDKEMGSNEHILMTEAYNKDIHGLMKFYGNNTVDGVQIPFNFVLLLGLRNSSDAYDYSRLIHNWLDNMPPGRVPNWVMGNHDQNRVGTRLGRDRIDLINIMAKVLPGVSVTYQGEEIGMTDAWISWEDTVDPAGCQSNPQEYKRLSRDPERTPFQWSDGYQAGFTNATRTWLPINPDYKLVNVKVERGIPYSHLNIYKQLQSLRKTRTMRYGKTEVIALSKSVMAIRRYITGGQTILALFNIDDNVEEIDAKAVFPDLSAQLEYKLTVSRSIRRKGDKVSADHIELLPKEAVILATI